MTTKWPMPELTSRELMLIVNALEQWNPNDSRLHDESEALAEELERRCGAVRRV